MAPKTVSAEMIAIEGAAFDVELAAVNPYREALYKFEADQANGRGAIGDGEDDLCGAFISFGLDDGTLNADDDELTRLHSRIECRGGEHVQSRCQLQLNWKAHRQLGFSEGGLESGSSGGDSDRGSWWWQGGWRG